MKNGKMILLLGFVALLVFTLVPSQTLALYSESFNQEESDYFFLKSATVNNGTSAVTGFALPSVDTNWMIEVTSLTDGPPTDNLSGKVYEDSGGYLDLWQPTSLFGSNEIPFGQYSDVSGYTMDSSFEAKFPVPLIIPTNITAVNVTLNVSLSAHFQYYQSQNISGPLIPPSNGSGDGDPFTAMLSLFNITGPLLMVCAWNGTGGFVNVTEVSPSRMDPQGDVGDVLLLAIYFEDGELNYLRESWWDNSTQRWRSMYRLISQTWELIGPMFEHMLIGSDSTGGEDIPGFECGFLLIGLMVSVVVIYLRKPKDEIII